MRVFSYTTLRDYWTRNASSRIPLTSWYRVASNATWNTFSEVRATLPRADEVKTPDGQFRLIFNIGGNNYRLVSGVNYEYHSLYVKWIGTHAEYDKIDPRSV